MSKSKTNSKKTAKKSGAALTKNALSIVQKNLAAIDAAERGKTSKKAAAPKKEKPARKPSLLDHAAAILAKSKDPLNVKQIIEKVRSTTEWKTNGKTPHATLYSALIREIANKGKDARFKKVERGLFAAAKGA